MTKRTISAITVAALMSAGIAFAVGDNTSNNINQPQAQRHFDGKFNKKDHHGNKDVLPHGFEGLNLTDAQKAQIKQIMEANRPAQPADNEQQRVQFQQKMQQRQAQEQALISNKSFDEKAARAMIAERQEARAQMENQHAAHELQHLKARHAVFQVLTPAQQKQFLDNQKQHQERRMKMHHERPQHMPQPTDKK
ncbi:Spy/CpxP family protein refolding chaperone [Neisseriaceae bacterium B1]